MSLNQFWGGFWMVFVVFYVFWWFPALLRPFLPAGLLNSGCLSSSSKCLTSNCWTSNWSADLTQEFMLLECFGAGGEKQLWNLITRITWSFSSSSVRLYSLLRPSSEGPCFSWILQVTRRFDVSYGAYGRHISKSIHILMFLMFSDVSSAEVMVAHLVPWTEGFASSAFKFHRFSKLGSGVFFSSSEFLDRKKLPCQGVESSPRPLCGEPAPGEKTMICCEMWNHGFVGWKSRRWTWVFRVPSMRASCGTLRVCEWNVKPSSMEEIQLEIVFLGNANGNGDITT